MKGRIYMRSLAPAKAAVFAVALALTVSGGHAKAETAQAPAESLVVGTKEAPPFALKDADGRWRGISIDLWADIAAELGMTYRLQETDLPGLLKGVETGAFDAAVAALTVTPERESRFDFTHPFYTTGLGIAARVETSAGPWPLLKRLFSSAFVQAVAALAVLLFAVGAIVWVFERRRNANQFGGSASQGLGSGFWWSAVTMTTVGYGDKAPITLGGRIVAVLWMFASVLIVSSFTGAIASALTVGQLEGAIRGPADLVNVRVGVVKDSTGESYVRGQRLRFRVYDTAAEGLQAISDGRLDAMVYDAPLLKYLVKTSFSERLQVIPRTFQRQDYAIALPAGSRLRESINRLLVKRIQRSEWQDTLFEYMGQ